MTELAADVMSWLFLALGAFFALTGAIGIDQSRNPCGRHGGWRETPVFSQAMSNPGARWQSVPS